MPPRFLGNTSFIFALRLLAAVSVTQENAGMNQYLIDFWLASRPSNYSNSHGVTSVSTAAKWC